MALVTSGLPGLPRRRGFGGNRDFKSLAARSFSLGSARNNWLYFHLSFRTASVICLRIAAGMGGA
jgi:hypothetical protein